MNTDLSKQGTPAVVAWRWRTHENAEQWRDGQPSEAEKKSRRSYKDWIEYAYELTPPAEPAQGVTDAEVEVAERAYDATHASETAAMRAALESFLRTRTASAQVSDSGSSAVVGSVTVRGDGKRSEIDLTAGHVNLPGGTYVLVAMPQANFLHPAKSAQADSFQARVAPWMQECFGPVISADREERDDRFLEEALELGQANGHTAERAHALVDYVYSRPIGHAPQEVGGVMVTLAALCLAHGFDMHAEGETELHRISNPETIAKIRAKQAAKPKGSALPVAQADSATEGDGIPAGLEAIARWIEFGCFNADSMSVRRTMAANVRAFIQPNPPIVSRSVAKRMDAQGEGAWVSGDVRGTFADADGKYADAPGVRDAPTDVVDDALRAWYGTEKPRSFPNAEREAFKKAVQVFLQGVAFNRIASTQPEQGTPKAICTICGAWVAPDEEAAHCAGHAKALSQPPNAAQEDGE